MKGGGGFGLCRAECHTKPICYREVVKTTKLFDKSFCDRNDNNRYGLITFRTISWGISKSSQIPALSEI